MAVQILNDMPDAAVHRGEPVARAARTQNAVVQNAPAEGTLADWRPRATHSGSRRNRPLFIAVVAGIHVIAILGFLSVRHITRNEQPAVPIVVELIEAPLDAEQAPPMAPPPMQEVAYALPTPDVVTIEVETIMPPAVNTAVASTATTQAAVPPMVESVEYVRAPAPVYPRESSRRREYGTVILRVLVDVSGHAAQILLAERLDADGLDVAAREAVQRALFRPHEVNGVRQAAQVLIPIEFTRRAS